MLSKFLIVGVGGSGGKTLRVLRQALLRKLSTVPDWEKSELPDAWQMLWIDTITNQSPGSFPEPLLPNEQYLGLVDDDDNWQGITHSLKDGLSTSEAESAFRSWLPRNPQFDPRNGAGQYRAVGRAVGLSQLETISIRLRDLKAKMDQTRSLEDLKIISEGLGYDVKSVPPEPFALVVSSLAGGSGAGMFADVADVLKTPGLDFDPKKILSILYGPDIFLQSLPEDLRGGVAPNTLAAVHEIIYGSRADGPDAGTRAVYRSNKMSDEKSDRIGGAFTFLMGMTNTESVSFDDQKDVYRAVGQSLTPWVLSEEIQTYFNEFLLAANGYPASGDIAIVSDNSGLRDTQKKEHTQSMAGFGFARVGLGIDRFNEYVAEVLAKESIDKLLWPRSSRTLDPNINLDELIQETISNSFVNFRARSGLNEKNPGNDVVDYIFKEDEIRSEASTNYKLKVQGRFRRQIPEGDSHSSAEVVRALEDSANREAKDFKSTVQKVVRDNTVKWADDYIQQKFINLVVETAGSVGLEVTSALIKRLADELQTDAYTELTVDSAKFARRTNEQRDQVAGKLGTTTAIDASSRILDPLLNIVIDAQMSGAKGLAYRQAAELVRDIAKNYLLPLARSLDSLRYALNESANAQRIQGEKNPYLSWPALGSRTPTQLQPGPTELVLIEPDDYPKILENMFKKSMPTDKQGQWREHLISSVIAGIPIDGGSGTDVLNQDLIESVRPWSPATLNNELEVVATFKFNESVRTYLTRAQRTPSINKAVRPYGTFVTQSLVEYLADDSGEASDNSASRNAKFGRLFSSAVRTSAPLMDINGTLLNQVHSRSNTPLLLLASPVPKEVEDVVRKELTKSNSWNLDGASSNVMMKFTTNKSDEITLFQVLAKPVHPMVFNTLWQPIEQVWGGLATRTDEREAWWGNDRRARPLSEAIPATKDRINALITGWFVAGFLKQRLVDRSDPARGFKLSILDDRGKALSFPHPLLGLQRNSPAQDQLPAVLVSLGLALMKCNTTSSLAPLEPYHQMMKFGDQADELLGQWLRTGKISVGIANHNNDEVGNTPETRRAWLLKRIDKAREAHEKIFKLIDESESLYNQPQVWEIRHLVFAALNKCEQSVHLLVDDPDEDDDSVEVE